MTTHSRQMASRVVIGHRIASLDATMPGFDAVAVIRIERWLERQESDKAGVPGMPPRAFIDRVAVHLDALRTSSPELPHVDSRIGSAAIGAAATLLGHVAGASIEAIGNPRRRAKELVKQEGERAGLPAAPSLQQLTRELLESWLRAASDAPSDRLAADRAIGEADFAATGAPGASASDPPVPNRTSPILHGGRETFSPGALAPSTLLDPRFAVVPFHEQGTLFDELTEWCDAGGPDVDVRLLSGPAGCGKSRLFVELAARLRERLDGRPQWHAGLLDTDGASPLPTPKRLALELASPERLLIGVDSAETHQGGATAVLDAVHLARAGKRTRVLLMARYGQLRSDLLYRPELDDAIGRPLGDHLVSRPDSFDMTFVDARKHFSVARAAFQLAMNLSVHAAPKLPANAEPSTDPLAVHASALASARRESSSSDGGDPLVEVLDCDRRQWTATLRRTPIDVGADAVEAIAAVLILVQGTIDRSTFGAIVTDVLGLLGRDVGATDQLRDMVLASRGVKGDGIVRPVRPDRLGELVVTRVLSDHPELLTLALDRRATSAGYPNRRAVLGVLARLARSQGAKGEQLLANALEAHLEDLVDEVVDISIEIRGPIDRIAAEVLETRADVELAARLVEALLQRQTPLRELTAAATRLLLAAPLPFTSSTAEKAERARRLHELSHRPELFIDSTGSSALTEAIRLRRELADSDPALFTPALASSLSAFADRFHRPERQKEALALGEEAVARYRELSTTQPDSFLVELAEALDTLAMLHDSDEAALERAREAVAIGRELFARCPEELATPLARWLVNLSAFLNFLGRHDEEIAAVEEMVAIRRRLARAGTESARLDLARSLRSLATRYVMVSRHDESCAPLFEASALYRELMAVRPAAYTVELADVLGTLSIFLDTPDQQEAALAAANERTSIMRQLYRANPHRFHHSLGQSLRHLSRCLGAVGSHEAALGAGEESLTVLRDLVEKRQRPFDHDLAASLLNLSRHLGAMDRHEEALSASEEAVSTCRAIIAADPSHEHSERLAEVLSSLSEHLATIGRREAALVAIEEAVELYGIVAASNPRWRSHPLENAADRLRSLRSTG